MPAIADSNSNAWTAFDELVDVPLTDPWEHSADGTTSYAPDFDLLLQLLAVPVRLGLATTSGLPAKAVDVWLAYELRRCGFGVDEVWPRAKPPRVLPTDVAALLARLPRTLADQLRSRLVDDRKLAAVVPSDARILGKAYVKQVDVVVAHWSRGPEILISSKRMGSSLSNNALNRVEESYGDAHNLRGRHPLAAIGYVLVVRGEEVRRSPGPARRMFDLIETMADEPAGYDASAVVIVDWDDDTAQVRLGPDASDKLSLSRFLPTLVSACLDRTPVDLHVRARELRDGTDLPLSDGSDSPTGPGQPVT